MLHASWLRTSFAEAIGDGGFQRVGRVGEAWKGVEEVGGCL